MRVTFDELLKLGWSGCMHDSDCACSPERRARDDEIIDQLDRDPIVDFQETLAREVAEETKVDKATVDRVLESYRRKLAYGRLP